MLRVGQAQLAHTLEPRALPACLNNALPRQLETGTYRRLFALTEGGIGLIPS